MQHSYSGSVTEAMESDVRPSKRLRVMEDRENTSSYSPITTTTADGFTNYDVFISHRGPDTKMGFVSYLHKDLVAAGLRPFLDCKSIGIGEDSWGCTEHAIRKAPIAVVIFSENFAQSAWCMRELHVVLHTPSVTVLPVFYDVRPSELRFPESGQLRHGFENLTRRHEKKVIDEWRADLEQASKLMGWEHSYPQKWSEPDLVSAVVGKVSELANKTLPSDVGECVVGVKQVTESIIQTLDGFANYDVFISHRGPDTRTGFVSFLHRDLVAAGLRPFLDCKSIDIGEDSWGCTEHAIRKAPIAVVIFSENFAQSAWCMRELHVVLHTPSVTVLPVFYNVRPSEVRFPASGQLKDGFEKLTRRHKKKEVDEWRADLEQVSKLMGWQHPDGYMRLEADLVSEVVGKVSELANKTLPSDVGECVVGVKQVTESIIQTLDGFANYDVFISHRGPDTKTGFVSFLHNHLVAAGLRPFLDCKSIDIGDDSWGCIEHAIRKAPIAVVIFSENFARSKWCMRELHVMLHTPSVTVLPVFYNVRPSEVSFPLSGQLKDGFVNLTRRHEKKVIDEWRADLEQASKLMGWEHSGAQKWLEADLVSEVVGKVSELANKALPLDVGECAIGVKQVAEAIIQTLDENKKVLGLWGMGGIGKSTLAREVYNQLCKRRYDSTCYVEDVTEKVNQGGVVRVQSRILKDLCKNGSPQIEDKSKGKVILEERLSGRRILLVLDDVRDNDEMDYWISSKMLSRGSLCIATSRNRRVFEKSNSFAIHDEVHIHDVQALSTVDSERVFASHAFGGHGTVKSGFEELVTDTSKACGGVPLVLKVCGALLKDEEDVDIWKEVMKKLNCGSIMDEDKIFACFRMSYDALQHEHRGMFLDIACVLLGKLKDLAIRFWKAQGWAGALGVRSLVEKALITVDGDGMLRMHDHLRDMGRRIVMEERRSDGFCKRLWVPESLSILENSEPLQDTLETMIAYNNDDDSNDDADDSAVDDDDEDDSRKVTLNLVHLTRLRILICAQNVSVTSRLPTSLCWLDLQGHMDIGGTIFQATPYNKLVILSLNNCNIQNLPESLGNFSHLEVLDMTFCKELKSLPDSFGRLRNLQHLRLCGSSIQSLPGSFGELRNLEMLDLTSCKELKTLPNSFERLRSLKQLNLHKSSIHGLPESFGELSNLEMLYLGSCKELKELPKSFGSLRNLKQLYLSSSGIRRLPESFGELCNLEKLYLGVCEELKELPKSFGRLRTLKQLYLSSSGIRRLPESFGELCNLEKLYLGFCEDLSSLPKSFGRLRNLKQLHLDGSGIQSLPKTFGDLINLEEL